MLKKGHNLKLIVDLRRPPECERLPDSKLFGVKYLNLPLLDEGRDEARKVTIKNITLPDMTYFYAQFPEEKRKDVWVKIFDLLLNTDGAVLFHCSAGKDRTGAVIALILMALGFDKETAYQDYLLTNQNPLFYKDIAEEKDPETKPIFLDHFSAKREYLDTTFQAIEDLYGSVEAFHEKICGLTPEKIEKLKAKFLP